MIRIDGSFGEGGGQILRTSLALAIITGQPFRVDNIRANRRKPGLLRQHLTAARAAAAICGGTQDGAELGSGNMTFHPGKVTPGDYHFSVGTAGSAMLVLQTVLPPLLTADAPSNLILEGGTHNPHAPPFPFIRDVFLPIIQGMGPQVDMTLERPGFYPAGGGRVRVHIRPQTQLKGFHLKERGALKQVQATAWLANLPSRIARTELEVCGEQLAIEPRDLHVEWAREAAGPGNMLAVTVKSEFTCEMFSAFGMPRFSAGHVAQKAAKQVRRYLRSGVPVAHHLADQLLLPLAQAPEGSFHTQAPSPHFTTNTHIIHVFTGLTFPLEQVSEKTVMVHRG